MQYNDPTLTAMLDASYDEAQRQNVRYGTQEAPESTEALRGMQQSYDILTEWRNQLIVSDALDYLRRFPDNSVPLFLFSPPYNLGNTTGGGLKQYKGHYADGATMASRGGQGKWRSADLADGYNGFGDHMAHADYVAWQQSILRECFRCLSNNGAIYYNHKPRILDGVLVEPSEYVPPELLAYRRQRVIWARAGGINFSPSFYCPTYEEILIIAKPDFRLKSKGASGVGDVWHFAQESNTWHPAPFPIGLPLRVLETVAPAFVVDPFCGSGTTAKAAQVLGINFYGCDQSAAYIEQAREELKARMVKGGKHGAAIQAGATLFDEI